MRPLRAPRANRVFGADEKRIRTKNTVMNKSKSNFGFNLRSPIVCGQVHRPHTIGDPRGRAAVRASLKSIFEIEHRIQ
jgi:hypothetical protein